DDYEVVRRIAVDVDFVVLGQAGHAVQQRLDGRRVHVDPLHDDHLVGTPEHAAGIVEPRRAAAARAGHPPDQAVAALLAQRLALLDVAGPDVLADLAVRHRVARLVDHEGVVPVLAEVYALLQRAARVGRADLGDPVELVAFGAPQLLDRAARRRDAPAGLARHDHGRDR